MHGVRREEGVPGRGSHACKSPGIRQWHQHLEKPLSMQGWAAEKTGEASPRPPQALTCHPHAPSLATVG